MTPRGIPTTVLVAPDSFKGSFSASAVAAAVGAGLERGGWEVDLCPVADGGEGTLAALGPVMGLEPVEVEVEDPLGRPVRATFGMTGVAAGGGGSEAGEPASRAGASGSRAGGGSRPGARQAARDRASTGPVAVVELAAASGLGLVTEAERDALAATSRGTGQLIRAALDAGARTVYVAAGGSASTDGGVGALEAIGPLDGARLVVLCDVRSPFERTADVFGPQKGADPAQVRTLAERLDTLAAGWPRDPRGEAMTGAAGGFAGGLWAVLGAELRAGASFVLEAVGLDARLARARAVVVGEGRLDRSTLAGKVAAEIATRARQTGVPAHAVVAVNALDRFDQRILDLQVILEATTLAELDAAGEALAATL